MASLNQIDQIITISIFQAPDQKIYSELPTPSFFSTLNAVVRFPT